MTDPDRFRGTGTFLVKGAEQSPVQYEITLFEVEQVLRAEGWIEASLGVLAYAQRVTGAQLKLGDGRIVDITIGSLTAKTTPGRAHVIVHGGL